MRRFYNWTEVKHQGYDETDVYQIPFLINHETIMGEADALLSGFVSYKDVNRIFRLQEAYAIIGEEKTYDEVGDLYCESME